MGFLDEGLQGAASGGLSGAALGPVGAGIGAVAGFAPSLFKLFSGAYQKQKANSINPTNPGFQMNQGVIDNANLYRDRYGNYQLPGYNNAKNDINTTAATTFNRGVNGASSSGDVLGLAADIAYGTNRNLNQLNVQNAQGKDAALADYTNAATQAGQEYLNKNQYDNEVYQQRLREKAGLTQAANENVYGAIGTAGALTSAYLNPKGKLSNDTLTKDKSATLLPSDLKMADINSVPLGQAGTGSAFILGGDPAAAQAISTIDYNNSLNLRRRQEAQLAAKALAKSYQDNIFKAKAGQLFNQELLAKDKAHIEQGIQYRGQGWDIYNPDPNKPAQLAASSQHINDRHRLLNQHDVATAIEKQFNEANDLYAKSKPGEYDPESLKQIHDFVTNHTLDDITENGLQLPQLQKMYDRSALLQHIVPTMTGVREFVKGNHRITENSFMPDATLKQIEGLHLEGAPAADLQKKTGLTVSEAKHIPDDVNRIRQMLDEEYRGNPEKRQKELIPNGIDSFSSPAYNQYLEQQTQQTSAKKQLYNGYLKPFVDAARAKAHEEHRSVNDFTAEDQRLQEEAAARARRTEKRTNDKAEQANAPTYYQDLTERMRTGVAGSGEELNEMFRNNPAYIHSLHIDKSNPDEWKLTVPAKYKTVAGKTETTEDGKVVPNSNRVLEKSAHTYTLHPNDPNLFHTAMSTIIKNDLGEQVAAPTKLLTPYGKGKVPGGMQNPNNTHAPDTKKPKQSAQHYGL